jgi:hypothetical protein
MRCIIRFIACNEMRRFRKPINHNKNRVSTFFDLGKPKIKSIEISTQGSVSTGKLFLMVYIVHTVVL